jgi:hypothetical protein
MSKTRHPLDFITDRLSTSLMNRMVSWCLRRMLIWVEHIGYIVKFPGVDDKDTSMTLAMNRLNISSPRSTKKRASHLYSPYSAKRRCNSDPTASGSSHVSQTQTVPLRRRSTSSADNEEPREPWGLLVSKTIGNPDIPLMVDSTGFGEICTFVDLNTGEREFNFSTTPVPIKDLLTP